MTHYSVAEAKDRFSSLLKEAETGGSVQITRRGKPVAYVVGVDQFSALAKPKMSFMEWVAEFRRDHAPEGIDLDPDEWLRDDHAKTPGRDFSW